MAVRYGELVNAYAVIAGINEPIPVSSVTAVYSLNKVPVCRLEVPLGIPLTLYLNDIPSYSPDVLLNSNLINRQCLVFVVINSGPGSIFSPWVTGKFLVFNGYISSTDFVRTGNSTSLNIELLHWLSLLTYGSAISPTFHPLNPKNSFFNIRLTLGGAGSPLAYAPLGLIEAISNPSAVIRNFWTNGLYRFLAGFLDTFAGSNPETALVRKSLDAFQPQLSVLPLKPALGPALPKILEALYGLLDPKPVLNIIESLAQTTIWAKLVEFGSLYLFDIIPYPTFYAISPVLEGTSSITATIYPEEILTISVDFNRPRSPVKRVYVYGGQLPLAGTAIENREEAIYPYIIGQYESSVDVGLTEFIHAPPYLYGLYSTLALLRPTVGGIDAPIPTARRPVNKTSTRYDAFIEAIQSSLNTYAKYHFIKNWLENRSVVISTPFRADIPPGACIRAVTGIDYGNIPYVGTVKSVTYKISTNTIPTTSYTLSSPKAGIELYFPDLTMDTHPLYAIHFNDPILPKIFHLPKV